MKKIITIALITSLLQTSISYSVPTEPPTGANFIPDNWYGYYVSDLSVDAQKNIKAELAADKGQDPVKALTDDITDFKTNNSPLGDEGQAIVEAFQSLLDNCKSDCDLSKYSEAIPDNPEQD